MSFSFPAARKRKVDKQKEKEKKRKTMDRIITMMKKSIVHSPAVMGYPGIPARRFLSTLYALPCLSAHPAVSRDLLPHSLTGHASRILLFRLGGGLAWCMMHCHADPNVYSQVHEGLSPQFMPRRKYNKPPDAILRSIACWTPLFGHADYPAAPPLECPHDINLPPASTPGSLVLPC